MLPLSTSEVMVIEGVSMTTSLLNQHNPLQQSIHFFALMPTDKCNLYPHCGNLSLQQRLFPKSKTHQNAELWNPVPIFTVT